MRRGLFDGDRVGNDCTSSVGLAWASFGADSITIANSKTMGPAKGYLRVGEYQSSDTDNTHSENITAANGAQVQKGALRSTRTSNYSVNLQRFKTEKPTGILGRIAPEELTAGNYHCKLVCRLVSGREFTVRDFDFTV